ncbi:hypothetical protein F1C10_08500 [Sphingomonas sp. NBWT7]|uniref:hypothetical protein n=1 Tax=Sphingomonas sp. NBWT7 TaxID=2596913 RepID=UPI00162AEA9A|nr:hypothetical protein [Sphingomonas sp. NBWT7]QNE31974.1 hypothetical protein F1C10_08500 [Sphingomonas sp. NBWT7]
MREAVEADKRRASDATPRICACVLMNHPYPGNLPLLRQVYAGRFSELLFLIPFERSDDPDVITTYRGSYVHAGYVTDALPRLRTIDCDYFLFVHDDVLLNPQFDESSFANLFPLGADDGFIPFAERTPTKLGDWEWYYSFLPKLLYPKSLMFGTGIEPGNLLRYLPSRDEIRAGFERSGAPFTERVEVDIRQADDPTSRAGSAERKPSAVMLDGLAAQIDHSSPTQRTVTRAAGEALRSVTAMLAAANDRDNGGGDVIDLPIPLAVSGFFTDCFVLPRSKLEPFAHHMGFAGAAGLFVEIIVPVLLHALCERVHTAESLVLDFRGFQKRYPLNDFLDRRKMAIHPFKFSTIRSQTQQAAFIEAILSLRNGQPIDPQRAAAIGLPPGFVDDATYVGWHPIEPWGRWTAGHHATITLRPPQSGGSRRLKVSVVAPVNAAFPRFTGTISIGSGPAQPYSIAHPKSQAVLIVDVDPAEGPILLKLMSTHLFRPRDVDPQSLDNRQLGIGLRAVEWI